MASKLSDLVPEPVSSPRKCSLLHWDGVLSVGRGTERKAQVLSNSGTLCLSSKKPPGAAIFVNMKENPNQIHLCYPS